MRVKGGVKTRRRHKRKLKQAKGYRLSHSTHYRQANQTLLHATQYSYVHRKKRLGQFKRLWIQRISFALEQFGISYSKFMFNLKSKKVVLNRKMLSELAINKPEIFSEIVELSK